MYVGLEWEVGRLVAMQPQRAFQGGHQALPLGVAGKRAGIDQHAAAGLDAMSDRAAFMSVRDTGVIAGP